MSLDVAALSDDELVVELATWSGRVAAGEGLVLRLLGELDAREAWAQIGVLSCAHWAAWKLGLTLTTAREKVRVARCLRDLPLLTDRMAQGRVSYAQVRAITRVATPANEADWIELARHTTASQLEKTARGVDRCRQDPASGSELPEAFRTSWDDDGFLVLQVRISPTEAPAVLARLQDARAAEQADRDRLYADLTTDLRASPAMRGASAEAPAPPFAEPYDYHEPPYPVVPQRVGLFDEPDPAGQAAIKAYRVELKRRQVLRDAARAWQDHVQAQAGAAELPSARASLADGLVRALLRPEGLKPTTVKLLVDPTSGWARTRTDDLIAPATLKQVLTTLPGRQIALKGPLQVRRQTPLDLQRHDLGRHARTVSPALRELLGHLDGERCRFPGCTRTTHLHAHHVRFWRDGGPTDLANLALVCTRHHTLIHAQGFQLVLSPDRTLTVRTTADIPVPHHPTPAPQTAQALDLSTDPYTSEWANDPFNLSYVVAVLLAHSS
jgi:hypothetical protein